MLESFNDIIRYDFAPLFALILAAIMCSIVGSFLVVKRSAMMVDAVGHAVFPGIVFGALMLELYGQDLIIFFGVITAFIVYGLIIFFKRYYDLSSNICIFYTGSFAVGIIMLHAFDLSNSTIGVHMLYGTVDTIFWPEMNSLSSLLSWHAWSQAPDAIRNIAYALLFAAVLIVLFFNGIVTVAFDKLFYSTIMIHSVTIELVFMSIIAVSCVIAFSTVGIISAVSLYIAPGVISVMIFNDSMIKYIYGTIAISVLGTIVGYTISAWLPQMWNYSLPLDTSGFIAFMFGLCVVIATIVDRIVAKNDIKVTE